MSRRVGIVVLVGVLLTGAARVVLADGGAGEREKENAARALRDYAARYVSAVAHLTPTYARQTGLACSACHTHFPELTPTGRAFKLNGYVFRRSESLEGKTPEGQQSLLLNLVAPVSLMFQTSYTSTKNALRVYAARYVLAGARLTPTYARQTGLACSACHTHFPELTPTGRAFKLNGYVFRRSESLEGKSPEGQQSLLLNLVAPVSLMFQTCTPARRRRCPAGRMARCSFPIS